MATKTSSITVQRSEKRFKYKGVDDLTEDQIAQLPWYKQINWISFVVIFTPMVGFLIGSQFVPLKRNTLILAIVQYFLTGMSITCGYHRLWSHKSYQASWPLKFVLAMWGAAAYQGSVRWWCRNHRSHHRYIDTNGDPYSVNKGFWYAHLGWMIFRQDLNRIGKVDVEDLKKDPLLKFQYENYLLLAFVFGFALPCAIAHFFWNDLAGGFVYASMARMTFVHQATFCVNSLAHTLGEQSYSKEHSSYDHVLTALVTLGEGYHNYHHEFPHDYRNGIRWYHWDPSKWTIKLLSFLGLTSDLQSFPDNEIQKARTQVQQQNLDQLKKEIDWGVPVDQLPKWTWEKVNQMSNQGLLLVIIDGVVHDVTKFQGHHPGGYKVLNFWKGRDATMAFSGEVYRHSKAARNLLAHMRVAKLSEKLE